MSGSAIWHNLPSSTGTSIEFALANHQRWLPSVVIIAPMILEALIEQTKMTILTCASYEL
jgi:hypothetical protein